MTLRLTREEMETHIYWNEETDCTACLVTFNNKLKKKLKESAEKFPDEIRIISEDSYGELVAEFPKSLVSFNVKTPKKYKNTRKMTEEQKQAFVERVHKKRS